MTWIGVSGLRHPDDVALCAGVGVDAMGFVVGFPTRVPWNLTLDEAEVLVLGVPETVQRVAVVGEDADRILEIARRLQPDIVQLHADEPPEQTQRIVSLLHAHDIRVMKTLRFHRDDGSPVTRRPHPGDPLAAAKAVIGTGVDLLMVDLVGPSRPADTGQQAGPDHERGKDREKGPVDTGRTALALARSIREGVDVPVVLAGGLRPDNVRAAMVAVSPYGVDVISGVERADHRKSPEQVAAFVAAVRAADGPPLLIG